MKESRIPFKLSENIDKVQNWKIGTLVTCVNNLDHFSSNMLNITVGKKYTILEITTSSTITIFDDNKHKHRYFNYHFNGIQFLRKEKLKKLKCSDHKK